MRMGSSRTVLLLLLLLAAAASVFAYVRISNAISDYQMHQMMQEQTPNEDLSPLPCDHPSCRDQLIRT